MASVNTATAPHTNADATGEEEKPTPFYHAAPGEQPSTDAGYFELLSFVMFTAAVGNRKLVTELWQDILYSFKNFHIQRVSEFSEQDLREVIERVPALNEKPQVPAVISSATAMLRIAQVYGSFKKYLRTFEQDGPEVLLKDVRERFPEVDRQIFQEFLKATAAGVKLPEAPRNNRGGKPNRTGRPPRRGTRGPGGQTPRSGQNGKPKPKAPRSNDGNTRADAGSGNQAEGQNKNQNKPRRPRRRRFSGRKKKDTSSSGSPSGG